MNRHRAVAFRAVVQSGQKQWLVPLPFDPITKWSTPARPLWRCGHGHRVRGSLNGQTFRALVVERAGGFWLLLEESLAMAAELGAGQSVDVLLEPDDA
ncbi:DUF1905 domain-containing protein [Dyella amyloliquefaciens]|uniref:DUF1905 domain-containing protein n=1 Tax=Dyella amyloliquefaciens TaxID=1770545 RepID=UPI00102E613D|nr:DUF1905 domain-containing protein [Dyella amyloliquefaciens]